LLLDLRGQIHRIGRQELGLTFDGLLTLPVQLEESGVGGEEVSIAVGKGRVLKHCFDGRA